MIRMEMRNLPSTIDQQRLLVGGVSAPRGASDLGVAQAGRRRDFPQDRTCGSGRGYVTQSNGRVDHGRVNVHDLRNRRPRLTTVVYRGRQMHAVLQRERS
jgi:hypothetical protein